MKPKDFLSSKHITVRQYDKNWVIKGAHRTVDFNQSDLAITVKSGENVWPMKPSQSDDLTIECDGKKIPLPLTSAGHIDISPYDTGQITGLKISLSDFKSEGKPLNFSLLLFICLEGSSEELIFEAIPTEGSTQIKELRWPRAVDPTVIDTTVMPTMQGMLIPRNWPHKVFLYDPMTYGRGLYMPWWGYQKGKSAAIMILETPADAGCALDHPAGGPTLTQLMWVHSLGKLGYTRRARMAFYDEGNYVTLAKRYRKYVIQNGHFVSLKEKIARNPIVGKMIGTPVVHTNILNHIQPDSSYYDKTNPANNHQLVTFDTRTTELEKLAEKGVKRAYVHVDGWGFRGYDNLHPDVLPPCPEAGGWEGMKRLADACDKLGFIFAIHDQYRDYYLDGASYQKRHSVQLEDGSFPWESTWYGGHQTLLCSKLAPGYVKRNHQELLDHGIKLRGAYLDVFAVVPGDECYNPEHPVTRAECLKYRGECFDLVRTRLGVTSSEEPADWAIPYLDLVHHAPYALDPNPGQKLAMGIPVPLFNLVYHDAIVLPWTSTPTKGGWGIPDTDSGYMHCLLNAGIPYLSINPDKAELARTRKMCALHSRVGLLEMTNHEFLDHSHRKQRTTYADGTQVTVDFDTDQFTISR